MALLIFTAWQFFRLFYSRWNSWKRYSLNFDEIFPLIEPSRWKWTNRCGTNHIKHNKSYDFLSIYFEALKLSSLWRRNRISILVNYFILTCEWKKFESLIRVFFPEKLWLVWWWAWWNGLNECDEKNLMNRHKINVMDCNFVLAPASNVKRNSTNRLLHQKMKHK